MMLSLQTITLCIWRDIRHALQVNASQFLDREISDYVKLEITYISVLCSPDQKPDAVSIPTWHPRRDAVTPIDHVLGKLRVLLPTPS